MSTTQRSLPWHTAYVLLKLALLLIILIGISLIGGAEMVSEMHRLATHGHTIRFAVIVVGLVGGMITFALALLRGDRDRPDLGLDNKAMALIVATALLVTVSTLTLLGLLPI